MRVMSVTTERVTQGLSGRWKTMIARAAELSVPPSQHLVATAVAHHDAVEHFSDAATLRAKPAGL